MSQTTVTPLEMMQIGRVIASHTHEMRNVLNVVRTSNGLIQDIQGMGKKGLKFADKVDKAAGKIDAHTRRGVELLRHMNSFGHAMDKADEEFSLNDLAEDAAALMDRLAGQKEKDLGPEPAGSDPKATGPRIRCLLALTMVIDAVITVEAKGEVSLTPVGDGIFISGAGMGQAADVLGALPQGLDEVLSAIGWNVAVDGDGIKVSV